MNKQKHYPMGYNPPKGKDPKNGYKTLDDLMREDGVLEEVNAAVEKRVKASERAKVKPTTEIQGWIIVDSRGKAFDDTFRATRKRTINDFIHEYGLWPGYKCRAVKAIIKIATK